MSIQKEVNQDLINLFDKHAQWSMLPNGDIQENKISKELDDQLKTVIEKMSSNEYRKESIEYFSKNDSEYNYLKDNLPFNQDERNQIENTHIKSELLKGFQDTKIDMEKNRLEEISVSEKEPITVLGVKIPFIKKDVEYLTQEWKTQSDKETYQRIKDDIELLKAEPTFNSEKAKQYQEKLDNHKNNIAELKGEHRQISLESRIENSNKFSTVFQKESEKVSQKNQTINQSQSIKM